MTNAEKYNLTREQAKELCYEIARFCNGTVQAGMIMDFFYCPLQPTLTEDEMIILRNLPKKYTLIERARDGDKNLIVSNKEDWEFMSTFNHLFQFIIERRRI